METANIKTIVDSITEFFFQLGFPVEKTKEFVLDILDLVLADCSLNVFLKLSPEKAEAFKRIFDSEESTEKKLALFWEKAVLEFGAEELRKMMEASLKEILSGYMDSMKKNIPPYQ